MELYILVEFATQPKAGFVGNSEKPPGYDVFYDFSDSVRFSVSEGSLELCDFAFTIRFSGASL